MAFPVIQRNYTPDHKHIISTQYGIDVIEVKSGNLLKRFKGFEDYYLPLFFSSDKKYLFTRGCGLIQKWDLNTGEKARYFNDINDNDGWVTKISKNDSVIASVRAYDISLWDSHDGTCINKIECKSKINSISLSFNGQYVVSASEDSLLRIWNTLSAKNVHTFGQGCAEATDIKYSNSGKYIVSIHKDNSIRIWDTNTYNCVKKYNIDNQIWEASFSPSENRISFFARSGKDVQIREFEQKEKSELIQSLKSDIPHGFWSPDGKFVISDNSSNNYLWDASSGKITSKYGCHLLLENGAVFSTDGKYVLSRYLGDGDVHLLETSTGKEIHHFGEKDNASFSFYGNCVVATSWRNNTVSLYSLISGKMIDTFSDDVLSAYISPDNQYIVSVKGVRGFGDGEIHIYDIENRRFVFREKCSTQYGNSVIFSLDSKYFCSRTEDNRLILWNLPERKRIGYLEGDIYESSNSQTVFSPDGNYVLSTCEDNTIRIWDVKSLKCVLTHKEFDFNIITASFGSDGNSIVLIANNGAIKILSWFPLQRLIYLTQKRFRNRLLTNEERNKYYLE